MKIRKRTCLIMVVALLLLLTSCKNRISTEEAKSYTDMFLIGMETEDYQSAAELFHPSLKSTAEEMRTYAENFEKENGVDFNKGIEIEDFSAVESALYDSKVGGAYYKLGLVLLVDSKKAYGIVEFVRNSDGFGIMNFHMVAE